MTSKTLGILKETRNKYHFDGCKLQYHMDRVDAHYKRGEWIAPLHIDIGATKKCNAKCVYCYGLYQKMSKEVISRDTLVSLFIDAPLLGVKSLTLTGDGEPTLNPAVYEAIDVGKSKGLAIGFATNGIFLDDTKIHSLLNSCTWLRFNLSAVSPDSYKSLHGVDQWNRVQANIKRTMALKKELKSDCTVGLQMVLIPECLDQIIPETKFALKYGIDYFVIKQFSDPGCKEMSRFALSWYDNAMVLEALKIAEGMSNATTKIIPKWGMIASKGKRPYDHCVDCPLIFQISGSSKCYPCGYLFGNEDYCYGSLKEHSLEEILHSQRYWEVVKHMRYKFDVHKECKGCCRHDFTNSFMWQYLHPPTHIDFI